VALLAALDVADPPSAWTSLGFSVVEGTVWVDNVAHRLGAPGAGLPGWVLWGVDGGSLSGEGIPTQTVDDLPETGPAEHPNGVTGLDHLVLMTPDHGRTVASLEGAGIECRRVRDLGARVQAFFRLGPVILEVVGPASPTGGGPASLFGLAWTSADLDATAALLGDRLRPAKEATQPGRMIATVDASAGSSVPMTFMSPPPR
jgi:hypothetical protein